jgi:hypothetical protein
MTLELTCFLVERAARTDGCCTSAYPEFVWGGFEVDLGVCRPDLSSGFWDSFLESLYKMKSICQCSFVNANEPTRLKAIQNAELRLLCDWLSCAAYKHVDEW